MSYKVSLPVFEGPFDLLVYLIEDAQVSIYDIPIAEITSSYLAYLKNMRELNVDLSSEFMVLAAELLQIKSRMMLPRNQSVQQPSPVEDPRNQLVERIIAYKRCKARAELLAERARAMEDVFTKPQEDLSVYLEHPDEVLDLKPDAFARAFQAFLRRKQKTDEMRRRYRILARDRQAMEDKMRSVAGRMRSVLCQGGDRMLFSDLPDPAGGNGDTVVSFLAVLQLIRDQYLDADQEALYGEISIRRGSRDLTSLAGPAGEKGAAAGGAGPENEGGARAAAAAGTAPGQGAAGQAGSHAGHKREEGDADVR